MLIFNAIRIYINFTEVPLVTLRQFSLALCCVAKSLLSKGVSDNAGIPSHVLSLLTR